MLIKVLTQLFAILFTVETTELCEPCALHVKRFYDELECQPIYFNGTCCPSEYNCTLYQDTLENQCPFNGKLYRYYESIPNRIVVPHCYENCRCVDENGPKVMCQQIDCQENNAKSGCYPKYEADQCCIVGYRCPPFGRLYECKVNGKTFYEGQKFDPEDDHTIQCVCQQGFNGTYDEPFCIKKKCLFELEFSGKIKQNCAPLFLKINDKIEECPHDFICFESADLNNLSKPAQNTTASCKYGENHLNLGDHFKRSYKNYKIECQCITPPYLMCYKIISLDIG